MLVLIESIVNAIVGFFTGLKNLFLIVLEFLLELLLAFVNFIHDIIFVFPGWLLNVVQRFGYNMYASAYNWVVDWFNSIGTFFEWSLTLPSGIAGIYLNLDLFLPMGHIMTVAIILLKAYSIVFAIRLYLKIKFRFGSFIFNLFK